MTENEMMELYPLQRSWRWQFDLGDKNQLASHIADMEADIKAEEEWRKRQAKIDYAAYQKATPEEKARWDAELVEIRKDRAEARQGREALQRLVAMLDKPEKQHLKAEIVRFVADLKPGDDIQAYRGLRLGMVLEADNDTKTMLEQIQKEQRRQAEEARHLAATVQEMKPHVLGVPAVVEQLNENRRDAMGDLYRVLYAPGFSTKQKAIADAMRETGNHVRQTTPILKKGGWKGISPGRVSLELAKMDKLFADANMTNPFASRKFNRARPVVETTYSKRKVDSDDPDSAAEIVPNRLGGYSRGET